MAHHTIVSSTVDGVDRWREILQFYSWCLRGQREDLVESKKGRESNPRKTDLPEIQVAELVS
jgi:hypothetical protein